MSWPARRPAVPASCSGLDVAAIKKALIDTCGNVTSAARSLCVPSADLRKFVWSRPNLADVIFEQIEQMIDKAWEILLDGLESHDLTQRLQAAKLILTLSEAGRRRGWGRHGATHDEPATEARAITLKWLD